MAAEILTWESLGLRLAVRAYGPADAPALVMLHGFLDTGAPFEPVARRLAERWRVLVPDHRGHGLSDHLGPGGYYHFPDYVLDLDGLFAHFGLAEAVIVGHSMGATVACYFAGAFPERARAVVAMDGLGPPWGPKGSEGAPDRMRGWIADVRRAEGQDVLAAPSLDAVADRIGRVSTGADRARLLEIARSNAVQDDAGRWRMRFDPLHRTRSPIAFDPARFRAFLAQITCPVLALWAERTPMHAPDEAERLAALRDVTAGTIAGAGHNLHHEQPDAVAEAISAFLDVRGL